MSPFIAALSMRCGASMRVMLRPATHTEFTASRKRAGEKAPSVVRFPKAALNALKFARLSGTPIKDLVTSGLAMRKAQDLTWAQMALAANAPMMTKAGVVDGRVEAGILPTGQVVGSIEELPTVADVIAGIVAEAEATLERLS